MLAIYLKDDWELDLFISKPVAFPSPLYRFHLSQGFPKFSPQVARLPVCPRVPRLPGPRLYCACIAARSRLASCGKMSHLVRLSTNSKSINSEVFLPEPLNSLGPSPGQDFALASCLGRWWLRCKTCTFTLKSFFILFTSRAKKWKESMTVEGVCRDEKGRNPWLDLVWSSF